MTCLLVTAGNCPECQPIALQRGVSTHSSCYSLPAASLYLHLIPSSGTPAAARQRFSKAVTRTHTHTHALSHVRVTSSTTMSLRPQSSIRRRWRGDGVRQIRLHRPRRPQIHPSSPAHLISAAERRRQRWDRKVQERMETVVKRGNRGGEERRRGGRKMICLIWTNSLSALEP